MNKTEVYEKLEDIFFDLFEQKINIAELGEGASLREELEMNSIGLLYMAMAITEKFGVEFDNEDFVNMKTIGDVVAKIEK